MKTLKITTEILSIFAFFFIATVAPTYGLGTRTVSSPTSGLSFGEENGYVTVTLQDCDLMTEIGKPRLPVRYVNLIIPADMNVDSVIILGELSESIEGTYNIIPAQYPIPTDTNPPPPWVDPDSETYNSDSPFPGKLAEQIRHGYFDGANRIVTIAIYPLQYVPLYGELTLYTSISFDLNLTPSDDQPIYPQIRLKHMQKVYDDALKHLVDNPEDIPVYGYKPELVDSIGSPPDTGLKPPCPCPLPSPYTIITADSLVSYFAEFVDWMNRKGIPAHVTPLSKISLIECCGISGDEVSQIYDEAGKIRQYLRGGYLSDGTVYSLLAGFSSGAYDEGDVVPARIGAGACHRVVDDPWPPGDPKMIPADLYFSDFNGDWNVDLDPYYGETPAYNCEGDAVDYYPEIFVGRIPCSDGQEILNWTEKILMYEQNPGNGDYSYLTRAYWTQADQCQGAHQAQRCQGYYPPYFTHDLTEEYPSHSHPDPTSPTGAQVVSEMSQGYGVVNWNHHGNSIASLVRTHGNHGPGSSWRVTTYDDYWSSEPEDGNGLDNLTNTDRYFVLDATECYNAAYDEAHHWGNTSIAEGAVFFADRGAVAFLGNTRWGYIYYSNQYRIDFLKALFGYEGTPPVYNIGACEAIVKPGAGYLAYSHNLFGSPEMPIWTDTPQQFQVTVNFEDDYVWVRDESDQPVQGAVVCFSHQDLPEYHVDTTSDAGYAYSDWDIEPENTYVVVTKPNFIPYRYELGHFHITSDTTMQGTVYFDGDVIVERDVTLTLLPNTTIMFATEDAYRSGFDQTKCELIVAGHLVAVGNRTDSIKFVPEEGSFDSWYGIRVISEGSAQLQYCLIEGAHVGLTLQDTFTDNISLNKFYNNVCGIKSSNGNAEVRSNRILCDSLGDYGIYLDCLASYPPGEAAAEYNTIENYKYGIYAFNSRTHIHGNYVHGSSSEGSIIGIYCSNCDEITVMGNSIGSGTFTDCYIKAYQSTLHINHCDFNSWLAGSLTERQAPSRLYPTRPTKSTATYTASGTETEIMAGPLEYTKDFCDLYGNPAYYITDWFYGMEWYANYQDPEEFGCVDVWPFEVTEIDFNINVADALTFEVQGFVLENVGTPECPLPGSELCSTPVYTVELPYGAHWKIGLPMTEQCCVDEPYFAAIYIYTDFYGMPDRPDLVSEDNPTDVCRSYNDYGYGWEDLVVDDGWPGEMILNSVGYTAPQNDCGWVPRGIVYDQSTGSVRKSRLARYSMIGIDCYKSNPDLGTEDSPGNNAILRCSNKSEYENAVDIRNYGNKGPAPTIITAKKNYWGTVLSPHPPVVVGFVDWEPALTVLPDYYGSLHHVQPAKQFDSDRVPQEFALFQNYPNPFNPHTEINYVLPFDRHVTLTIYNILGQKVITLVDEFQRAGKKTVHWDGRNQKGDEVPSGIYFYRIKAGDFSQARKMLMIK